MNGDPERDEWHLTRRGWVIASGRCPEELVLTRTYTRVGRTERYFDTTCHAQDEHVVEALLRIYGMHPRPGYDDFAERNGSPPPTR